MRPSAPAARRLEVWGTGTPRREFLHVDDAADALVWLLKNYSGDSHVNVGSGEDITIADLARTIASVVGVEAAITFDPTKPDGTPRKLMDVSRLFATGWRPGYRFAVDWNRHMRGFSSMLRKVMSASARSEPRRKTATHFSWNCLGPPPHPERSDAFVRVEDGRDGLRLGVGDRCFGIVAREIEQ